MPYFVNCNMSCGVQQLVGLGGDPLATIRYVKNNLPVVGMIIFSDAVRYGNGRKLAAFIRKNKLGKISPGHMAGNPIHHNQPIQVWVWAWNKEKVRNFEL